MLLLHFPPPEGIVGGREIRSYETARALVSMGARVLVLALDEGPLYSVVDGVPVVRPRRLLGPLAFPLAPFLAIILAIAAGGGRGLVYIPYPPGLSSRILDSASLVVLSVASSIGLIGLWINIHDPLIEQLLYSSRPRAPGMGEKLLDFLLAPAAGSARIVTAASEAVARRLRRVGVPAGVYYAGVNPGIVGETPPWRGWRGRIGYTGSPVDDDLALLSRAAERVKDSCGDVEIVILTTSRTALPPGTRRVPAKYMDFPRAASMVDVFVLPRGRNPLHDGTLPNKLPMYLASKRPVAITLTIEARWYLYGFLARVCGWPSHLYASGPDRLHEAIIEACRHEDTRGPEVYARCMAEKASWRETLKRALCQAAGS